MNGSIISDIFNTLKNPLRIWESLFMDKPTLQMSWCGKCKPGQVQLETALFCLHPNPKASCWALIIQLNPPASRVAWGIDPSRSLCDSERENTAVSPVTQWVQKEQNSCDEHSCENLKSCPVIDSMLSWLELNRDTVCICSTIVEMRGGGRSVGVLIISHWLHSRRPQLPSDFDPGMLLRARTLVCLVHQSSVALQCWLLPVNNTAVVRAWLALQGVVCCFEDRFTVSGKVCCPC